MASSPCVPSSDSRRGPSARWLRALASLKLAVVIMVILAVVLGVTTFVEAVKGREYVRWYVYGSLWFAALLGLLAANIFASAAVRYPWKRRQIPFLLTHAGLLVLLAGSVQTFQGGIEGQLVLPEGEMADQIVVNDRCQFTARWMDSQVQQNRWPAAFVLQPGPVDWPEGKSLDLGEGSGVRLRIIKYFCRAARHENWVADDSEAAMPALKFALAASGGKAGEGQWLVPGPFGALASMGPLQFEFHRVSVASMLEDFLKPPPSDTDPSGVLSIHHEGRVQRIPVSKNVGKRVPVGESKISVEVAEYLPNAQPSAGFRFVSDGTEPKNPLLELRVYVPDKKEPIRQVAFANHPFQNFDGVHGRNCPVKFWYHHPAAKTSLGAQFLQTPDGKLHCRVANGGKYEVKGEIHAGDRVELPSKFCAQIIAFLPRARCEVTFSPLGTSAAQDAGPQAAACLEVAVGGQTQEVWLKQNDKEYGMRRLMTPEGPLTLAFGNEYLPLGFSLKLVKFDRGLDPGGMSDASYTSTVRLLDKANNVDEEREIAMNQPLVHRKFAFYQSSFDESPEGKAATVLTVAYDPGRFLKYLGVLLICVGAPWMFVKKFNRSDSCGVSSQP